MANICENTIHFCSTNSKNHKFFRNFLIENFGEDDTEFTYETDDLLEATFQSKWTFPVELMEKMYADMPDKKDLGIICLSVEWGNRYCQFHSCDSDGWVCD